MSRRRVSAIVREERRECRRNGNIAYAMAILPLIFVIQPLIRVFSSVSAGGSRRRSSTARG